LGFFFFLMGDVWGGWGVGVFAGAGGGGG